VINAGSCGGGLICWFEAVASARHILVFVDT